MPAPSAGAGDPAARAAAEVIVRFVFGDTAEVEPWHLAMSRQALDAAELHRAAPDSDPGRDSRSTLSASTQLAPRPWTRDAARRVTAGTRFGFGAH